MIELTMDELHKLRDDISSIGEVCADLIDAEPISDQATFEFIWGKSARKVACASWLGRTFVLVVYVIPIYKPDESSLGWMNNATPDRGVMVVDLR